MRIANEVGLGEMGCCALIHLMRNVCSRAIRCERRPISVTAVATASASARCLPRGARNHDGKETSLAKPQTTRCQRQFIRASDFSPFPLPLFPVPTDRSYQDSGADTECRAVTDRHGAADTVHCMVGQRIQELLLKSVEGLNSLR